MLFIGLGSIVCMSWASPSAVSAIWSELHSVCVYWYLWGHSGILSFKYTEYQHYPERGGKGGREACKKTSIKCDVNVDSTVLNLPVSIQWAGEHESRDQPPPRKAPLRDTIRLYPASRSGSPERV